MNVERRASLDEPRAPKADIEMREVGNDTLGHFDLKASIRLAHQDGSFPDPDISNAETMAASMTDWARNHALMNDLDDNYYAKRSNVIVGLTAYFAPELSLNDPGLRSLLYLFYILLIFDDIMDRENLNPQDVKQAINDFKHIFGGKTTKINKLASPDFPYYRGLCEIISDFLDYCAKNIDDYKTKNSIFVKNIRDFFDSVAAEHGYFHDAIKSEGNFLFLRKSTFGAKPLLAHLSIMLNITIGKNIRKNKMFKRYNDAAAKIMAITNDLLSLRKEINKAEESNLVLVKIHANHVSLPDAFVEANNLLNKEINDLIDIGQQLRNAFSQNKELIRYLEMTENAIDGHLRWYGSKLCRRYGQICFHIIMI